MPAGTESNFTRTNLVFYGYYKMLPFNQGYIISNFGLNINSYQGEAS